ncbi:MAG TPA: hypothetical protein VMX54_08285 [Vicinamibacteria bacterium]|nr:hypothetical protein [Vicinamibacteria bacterium]
MLDEFADASGRPLRAALEASGLGAREYLSNIFFYDAPRRTCGTDALAVTTPSSRVIFACGERFVRQMSRNSRHARASSDYITERVLARCGERRGMGSVAGV